MMLLWVSEINRYFRLGESLHQTIRRRWHDLLCFRLAMAAEAKVVERMREQTNG